MARARTAFQLLRNIKNLCEKLPDAAWMAYGDSQNTTVLIETEEQLIKLLNGERLVSYTSAPPPLSLSGRMHEREE